VSNAFQRFGINYLSPSSVNTWIKSPGLWCLSYIAKMRDAGNANMWRGTAVEAGFKLLLHGQPMSAAVAEAYRIFDQIVAENRSIEMRSTEDIVSQRGLIIPMLGQAAQWQAPGRPNGSQLKITCNLPDVPVPVIGYVDFAFEGLDVDCKTSERITNKIPADHARQVSTYRFARDGRRGGLLYVTAGKHNFLEVDDATMRDSIDEMRAAAMSIGRFLAKCDSREDAVLSLPIDWDAWTAPKQKVSTDQIIAHMRQAA
jgi:hypothetical protein